MSRHTDQLGLEPVLPLLLRLALPSLIGLMISNLYVIVDRVFVGRYVGEAGLAAMSAAMPITMIVFAVTILIGRGSSVMYSIALGEKNYREVQRIFGYSMLLYLIAAVVITTGGLFYLDELLLAFGGPPSALAQGRAYLSVSLCGTVFVMLSFHNALIRAEGFSKLAMFTQILGAVVNIGLDYVFVVLCDWGMAGAAWATITAQACSAAWVMLFFLSPRSVAKLRLSSLRFYGWRRLLRMLYNGCSPFAIGIMGSLIWTVQNHQLVRHGGETAMAAFGVILSLAQLLMTPLFGISMGMQPIIGYNTGARLYKRVHSTFFYAIRLSAIAVLVPYLLIQIFPNQIIAFFVSKEASGELIKLGAYSLRRYLLLFPLGCGGILVSQYFQAIGRAHMALLIAVCRQLLFQLPLTFFLPTFFAYNGVLFSGPIGDTLAFLIAFVLMRAELKQLNKKIQEKIPL